MNDRDIPGMGDYSPPEEPDEERAGEDALIAVATWAGRVCVDDLHDLAEEEHAAYFRSIGENPDLHAFGDYIGLWHNIYMDAHDAFGEGKRLDNIRKQGEPRDA